MDSLYRPRKVRAIPMRMFCQECHKEVFPHDFRNGPRDFLMTGLCQDCLDQQGLWEWQELNLSDEEKRYE